MDPCKKKLRNSKENKKEIQSIRLCEILEQRNKAQEDLEARNHEQ